MFLGLPDESRLFASRRGDPKTFLTIFIFIFMFEFQYPYLYATEPRVSEFVREERFPRLHPAPAKSVKEK